MYLPAVLRPVLDKIGLDVDAASSKAAAQQQLTDYYQGRVAAVTGAGSGIGRALAQTLAELGCDLALSDIDADNLTETEQMIESQCQLMDNAIHISTCVLDVADADAVSAWADQVISDHGKVNFIFNNAGVALSATAEAVSLDNFRWIMDINFWGVVYGSKAFLPLIKQTAKNTGEHGHIINISSLFGLVALPSQSTYNASKFAVRGFTESLRQELDIQGENVSATCVHPGGINTNIANNARGDDSIASIGMASGAAAVQQMNKLLKFDANQAAQIILLAVANDARRCLIGNDAKMMDALQRLFPASYPKVVATLRKQSRRLSKMRRKQDAT